MKEELGGYETRLLAELTEVVEKRSASRSWFTMPKLAMGGVALAALAVTGGLTLPVFGGASERSPDQDTAATAPGYEPVGFSLALDGDEITVTVDDITDGAALEAALAEEGVEAQVAILDGGEGPCTWSFHEGPADITEVEADRGEDGSSSFTIRPADIGGGENLVVAIYEGTSDAGPVTTVIVAIVDKSATCS
ncbi:MAG TPA: hypothetical protein VGF17_15300 [Phytomonospora sp.]